MRDNFNFIFFLAEGRAESDLVTLYRNIHAPVHAPKP